MTLPITIRKYGATIEKHTPQINQGGDFPISDAALRGHRGQVGAEEANKTAHSLGGGSVCHKGHPPSREPGDVLGH